MDPIAHTFLGAALAQTPLRKRTACAPAALILGANLPDIDGIAMLVDPDTALLLRRGWTHGLPAILLIPLVLTGILILWSHFRKQATGNGSPPLRIRALLGLSYLAVVTHPFLDWLNNYGMRWLMPIDGKWFYGDAVFIVDPWMWLLLGGVVFLGRSHHWVSITSWAAFASFAAYLITTAVPGLLTAKILWFSILGGLILLRIKKIGFEPAASFRWAIGSVTAAGVYIGAMLAISLYASSLTAETLSQRGLRVERLMVGPTPVTPFVKDVVAQTPDGYRYGTVRLLPEFELDLSPRTIPLLPPTEVVRLATASPKVRGFMTWARFPFSEIRESRTAFTVYLLDARYSRFRRGSFGSARVEVSKDQLDGGGVE